MIKYLNQVYYLATWKLSSLMRNVFTLLHEQILMTRWWSSILPNRNPKVRPIRVSIFSADCTFLSLGLLSVPEDWEEAVPLCDRLLRRRWLWRMGQLGRIEEAADLSKKVGPEPSLQRRMKLASWDCLSLRMKSSAVAWQFPTRKYF